MDPDPDRIQGCVAVVADDRGSLVVDAGNSPAVAYDVQRAIAEQGLPAPRRLVYTHHHWDHVWGACAWEGIEIIAHASAAPLLAAEEARPWSHDYLRDQVDANPRLGPSFTARATAMTTWDGFRVVPPHRTFDQALTVAGSQVRHVGGQHAPDSTVVAVPDSGVLLLGDCFYPPPYHLRSPDDGPDVAMVRRLVDEGYEWYVDAHSAPWRGSDLPAETTE
ncbi:MAG: MBL fold metallo-hydrolase [Propionibacteriales bacterium]|nr:MBL fold metallo-hydrolase [Propionibacteriales bacterium]